MCLFVRNIYFIGHHNILYFVHKYKKDRRLGNYMGVFLFFFVLWLQKDGRCSDGEGAVLNVVRRRQRERCVPRRAEGKPKIRNAAMKREMPQCI